MLSPKQIRFAEEYCIDNCAKDAAIRAGYSHKTAKEKGYQLLQIKEIKEIIDIKKQEVSKKIDVDIYWVAKRFKEISDRCMTAEPVMIFDGEHWVESGEYKFDSSGANKATEMLGKHLGFFEKDNSQKDKPISAPIINVYGNCPPMANSEDKIQDK